jgi:hypothetical protein
MSTKSKLTFAVAAVAVAFSMPAFAQAVDHTGTLQPSYYNSIGKQVFGSWTTNGSNLEPVVQTRPLYNSAQARPLYNSAATPNYGGAATSGYDPSIATQR